jgi:hypothetical protein
MAISLMKIRLRYDKSEIMQIGNRPGPKIPLNPDDARSPAVPWTQQVVVEIQKFSVFWVTEQPFENEA